MGTAFDLTLAPETVSDAVYGGGLGIGALPAQGPFRARLVIDGATATLAFAEGEVLALQPTSSDACGVVTHWQSAGTVPNVRLSPGKFELRRTPVCLCQPDNICKHSSQVVAGSVAMAPAGAEAPRIAAPLPARPRPPWAAAVLRFPYPMSPGAPVVTSDAPGGLVTTPSQTLGAWNVRFRD